MARPSSVRIFTVWSLSIPRTIKSKYRRTIRPGFSGSIRMRMASHSTKSRLAWPASSRRNVGDYVCNERDCAEFAKTISTRHIILKDTQVLADGTLMDEEDPDFCQSQQAAAPTGALGQGFALARTRPARGRQLHQRSLVFHSERSAISDIPVTAAGGEIWRITNASGSATYDLRLWNPAQNQDMIFQVLSIDGVGISPTPGASQQSIAQIFGHKVRPVPCPGVVPPAHGIVRAEPLCTTNLLMMPSTRAEIWVAYRDAKGSLTIPPAGAQAIFRTAGFNTGPTVILGRRSISAPWFSRGWSKTDARWR